MITGNDIVKDFDGLKALDGATFAVERTSATTVASSLPIPPSRMRLRIIHCP